MPPREVTIDAPLIRRGSTGKSCIDNFWLFFALSNISLLGCCSKGKSMKAIKDQCLLTGAFDVAPAIACDRADAHLGEVPIELETKPE